VQWKRVAATPETPAAKDAPKRPPRAWPFVALGVSALLALLLVARAVFLPGYLRDAAIASAADQGVTLSVDDVNLDGQSVVMRGLVVKLEGVPQATATIASTSALLSWSGPIKVTLGNVEVVVDGDVHAVTA